jgi:hypothetical protein
MTGKAFIASEVPAAIGVLTDGQQHLNEMVPTGEKIAWLVEDAMSQACSYKDAYEAVQKERLKLLVGQLLLSVQVLDNKVCQQQSYQPAGGIPAYGKRTKIEYYCIRIPIYK